jgi:hypothetical protein
MGEWPGLLAPFIHLVGYAAPQDVPNGIAGKVEVTSNFSNSLAVSEMCLSNFTDSFHDQHLLGTPPLF